MRKEVKREHDDFMREIRRRRAKLAIRKARRARRARRLKKLAHWITALTFIYIVASPIGVILFGIYAFIQYFIVGVESLTED